MDADVEAVLRASATRDDLTPEERAYVERRLAGPSPRELARDGDRALRAGRYREAARAYREAAGSCRASGCCSGRPASCARRRGCVGPLVRARQLRIERSLGLTEEHVR